MLKKSWKNVLVGASHAAGFIGNAAEWLWFG